MRVEPGMRNALNEQATLIQDALDVATIQDDVIRAVKEDPRMADFKRTEFLKDLDGKILPLTTVCHARRVIRLILVVQSVCGSTGVL